jgi:hypothetical protein
MKKDLQHFAAVMAVGIYYGWGFFGILLANAA